MFLSLMWAMCAGMPSVQAQSYDKLWKKVEQAQEKSLPQTVIELADEIYQKGMSEQNAGQVLKAALCRDAYREYLTPDSLYKDLVTLEQWAQKEENAVTQSILYSLLAGRYADYAAGNRYQLAVRAELDEEMPSEDIREWSAGQFFRKVDACVQASLQRKEALLAATSDGYVPFVEQADGSGLYGHDMYHLLAKRAAEQYGRMAGFGQDSLALDRVDGIYEQMMAAYEDVPGREDAWLLSTLDYWDWKTAEGLGVWPAETRETHATTLRKEYLQWLDRMIGKYGSRPIGVEVYIRKAGLLLGDGMKRYADALRVCEEGIGRYASQKRVNELAGMSETQNQASVPPGTASLVVLRCSSTTQRHT